MSSTTKDTRPAGCRERQKQMGVGVHPRTCAICGLGPCKYREHETAQQNPLPYEPTDELPPLEMAISRLDSFVKVLTDPNRKASLHWIRGMNGTPVKTDMLVRDLQVVIEAAEELQQKTSWSRHDLAYAIHDPAGKGFFIRDVNALIQRCAKVTTPGHVDNPTEVANEIANLLIGICER